LNKTVNKGETRTDWKKRPLTEQQLLYAQEDVEHLIDLYDQLDRSLKSMQRTDWYQEELNDWLDELEEGENEPQWHRISGASRLSRRGLAVLHELWLARDRIACQKNCSPRRVIPDDLLIELAKRGSSRPVHFRSIRGFSHRVAKDLNDQISQAIARANELTEKQLPKKIDRTQSVQLGLVGQYLSIVLGVVCQRNQIAPPLVGTNQELRELAAWHLGKLCENPVPKLSHGWRAAIVGEVIQQALAGKLALRIDNANSDQPLSIRVDSGSENTNNRPTENI
jgi:ribonuclease D